MLVSVKVVSGWLVPPLSVRFVVLIVYHENILSMFCTMIKKLEVSGGQICDGPMPKLILLRAYSYYTPVILLS